MIEITPLFKNLLFLVGGIFLMAACTKIEPVNIDFAYKEKNERNFLSYADSLGYIELNAPSKNGFIFYKPIYRSNSGIKPFVTSSVKVKYSGWLIDGTRFDTTEETADANGRTFTVSSVIQGWTTALIHMEEGDKWRIVIPWELGYGSGGKNGTVPIPAFSTLVFDVELMKVTHL